jgi:uncharacterized RDD family membrane protein YckC
MNIVNSDEYIYAGFWIRVYAVLIDLVLFSMVFFVLNGLFNIIYNVLVDPVFNIGDIFSLYNYNLLYNNNETSSITIIKYIIFFLVTIIFWNFKNATPGKMLLGIIIVDADTGSKLTVQQMLIRYVGYIISAFVLFCGYFWVAVDRKKQALHDKLARSVVLRKKKTVDDVKFDQV